VSARVIAAVVAAIAAFAGCATPAPTPAPPVAPRSLDSFERRDADIYLVPIGDFAPKYLTDLASYYEDVFALKVGITPQLPFDADFWNDKRHQLIAENVIGNIISIYHAYSSNPRAIFIGVTHVDMYIEAEDWRFAYAQRIADFAVVTSSRTTREPQPNFVEITEVHPGLRKMVTKTVGLLYYKKSMNSNPRSVLYGKVLGLRDLEAIDESTLYLDILGRPAPGQ
jgi:predicted Zn-dependent protease